MAQRYSTLPSNLLRRADSFDYMVFDVATTYAQYKQSQKDGTVPEGMYSQQELEETFNRTRG
jgi:hypothetical protein